MSAPLWVFCVVGAVVIEVVYEGVAVLVHQNVSTEADFEFADEGECVIEAINIYPILVDAIFAVVEVPVTFHGALKLVIDVGASVR